MSVLTTLVTDSAFVTIILALATLLFLFLLFKSSKKDGQYKFPPGPKPLPIIGNLNILDTDRPQDTMCKLAEQYGDVFTFHMGKEKYVVITGYEAVKEALVTQADTFGERGLTTALGNITKGTGIIFGTGESWKTMRRFALSTLRDFGMGRSTIEDRIVEEAQKLLAVFQEHHGEPFNPMISINSAVSNVICQLVFGHRFEYDDKQFLQLQSRVNETIRLSASRSLQIYNMFPWLGRLLGDVKKMLRNTETNRAYFRKVCQQRRSELDSNDLRSFMDSFLARQKDSKNQNKYFHEENMVSSVANLFAAGTETTSTTLRWGLLLMMKYPCIQDKVQTEIEQVIGRDRPPRLEDRKNMPYTDAVVHEIQRFGNVVPSNLLHQTKVDTTFRNYHIPKGTLVIPLLTSVLYDKTQWETPMQFNPGHFLDAEGHFVKRDAFIPFSAGRRVCVGETLAKMELFLFFAALLQRFRFQPPQGVRTEDLDLTSSPGLTSAPLPYKLCAVNY
ncbi:cytochrome P450 2K1-like [Brienomyrus brachyistius]|uniref:cytochrome P450 2K1-like n=1 Tax=Brienomyrus brachyistius TaxID=42636 RepID=UPI0020B2E83C|nr:cytochrome P450 2K1-like [Brienomyrus brachyistius]